MRNIIGYCRVSTKMQQKAIGSQIFAINKFAEKKKFNLIALHDELKSGSCNFVKYGLLYNIVQEAIKNNADICVTEPSRLTRNLSIAKEIRNVLLQNNLKVIFINNLDLFDNEECYCAEFKKEEEELKKISERTKRGMIKVKAPLRDFKFTKEEIKHYLLTPFFKVRKIKGIDKNELMKLARKAHIEQLISEAEDAMKDKETNPFTGEKKWTALDIAKINIWYDKVKEKERPQSQSLLSA